jgi:hypothetical protein
MEKSMKFNKNKALVALSITMLLSTQTKPMGHDAELALQAPMAELSIVNPTLSEQAFNAFSTAKNFTLDSTKSLYGVALDNKALVAGVAGMGVGVLAYKKYPKSAIATGVTGSAVTAAALTSKYAPEAIEKGKELAVNAGNSVATFAKDAGNYMVEAGKSAGTFVVANAVEAVNFVAANTPEIVKNNLVPTAIVAGGAAFGAYKAYAPVKNAVKKTIASPAFGKTLAVAPAVAVTGMIAYHNQEAISNMAKEVVSSLSNGASAVKNADYAKYGQKAVDAVKPLGQFAMKQANKLRVNGARLVDAARNVDFKSMANNSKDFIANHKLAVGATVGTPAVLGAGYVIDKHVMPNLQDLAERRQVKKLAAHIANADDVVAVVNPEEVISVDSMTVKMDHSPVTQAEINAITSMLDKPAPITVTQMAARATTKPKPAKSVVEQTILPGQEAA